VIRSEQLSALPGVAHAFFTRRGGCSTGLYATLNCGAGSDDNPAHVRENRAQVLAQFDAAHCLNTVYQVHGTDVAVATGPWPTEPPKADGLVSATPGVVLGILTADCAPVLFADADAGVVGAAHCGWRGTLHGVAERVIKGMESLGATTARITAIIGPTIAQASYEVTADFEETVIGADAEGAAFFLPGRPGHAQFDLPGYVCRRLARAGISDVAWTGHNTYDLEGDFFSYRRATHRDEPDYGRQISTIALAP
jgi:YfiH family protein